MAKASAVRDRVNIYYRDQESSEERELPLKILVIGDHTGHEDDRPLEERKPIRVDRQNLGAVLAEFGLRLRLSCPSALSDDPEDRISVDLKFRSFADFGPEWVAHQVPELQTLVSSRRLLADFKPWLRISPSLVFRLQQALASPDNRAALRRELAQGIAETPEEGEAELFDWIVEGAEVAAEDPDYPELRAGVETYLSARLPAFDDPEPVRWAEAEPAEELEAPASTTAASSAAVSPNEASPGAAGDAATALPTLEPPSLADTHPAGAAPELSAPEPEPALLATAKAMAKASSEAGGPQLLDELLEHGEVVPGGRRAFGRSYEPSEIEVDAASVDLIIVELDRVLTAQVNHILHHEQFQALESTWMALRFLVAHVNFRENIQIHVLNCAKQDLIDDFEDAPEIAKSGLYRLVYSKEYGTFGGEPYGVVVCDYEFDPGPVDMNLLANCAAVASMAHVPFLTNASPRFFGEQSYDRLAIYDDVRAVFQNPQYTRWHSFRGSEDARYVGMCLPRFLLRRLYNRQDVHDFVFDERSEQKRDYLWGHAAYLLATRVAESFARYRWSPNIVGPTAGGAVEGLPLLDFASMAGVEQRMPTEIQLTERHEFELSEEGFIGVVYLKADAKACFLSANSCQRPKVFANTEAGQAAELGSRLGTQLPYVFIVCRIAHYLKVLQREEIGRHLGRSDLERELNTWLRQYVSDMENPAPSIRGKRPLRQAEIAVEEVPGQSGWYRVGLRLRPHLKYMGVSFTLSLVGKLEREN